MDAYTALAYIGLGAVLGADGQGARAIVGVKKGIDKASLSGKVKEEWFKEEFEAKRFIVSLLIGGIAGILGAILLLGTEVDRKFLLSLVAAGYAGADFIEGFMITNVSK